MVPVEGVAVDKFSDQVPPLTATLLYTKVVEPEVIVTLTDVSLNGALPTIIGF